MSEQENLRDAHIVIARAEGRGESLAQRIRAAGGTSLLVPVIAIQPLAPPALPARNPAWLIFASAAAVEHGLPVVRDRLGPDTRVAAIGKATATVLESEGVAVDALPEMQESEGMLALPAFRDVADRQVWIIRGQGGRALLMDTLRDRGAHVSAIEVYARRLPETDTRRLLDAWQTGEIDAIVVSSSASLANLHALLDAHGRRHLGETQLVVPTERMIKLAHELDIRPAPLVAAGASDDAFMTALTLWWRDRHQDSR